MLQHANRLAKIPLCTFSVVGRVMQSTQVIEHTCPVGIPGIEFVYNPERLREVRFRLYKLFILTGKSAQVIQDHRKITFRRSFSQYLESLQTRSHRLGTSPSGEKHASKIAKSFGPLNSVPGLFRLLNRQPVIALRI